MKLDQFSVALKKLNETQKHRRNWIYSIIRSIGEIGSTISSMGGTKPAFISGTEETGSVFISINEIILTISS
jgi:hypothetical protein